MACHHGASWAGSDAAAVEAQEWENDSAEGKYFWVKAADEVRCAGPGLVSVGSVPAEVGLGSRCSALVCVWYRVCGQRSSAWPGEDVVQSWVWSRPSARGRNHVHWEKHVRPRKDPGTAKV